MANGEEAGYHAVTLSGALAEAISNIAGSIYDTQELLKSARDVLGTKKMTSFEFG